MKDRTSHRACSIYLNSETRNACPLAGQDFPNKLISVSRWKVTETERLADFHREGYTRFDWNTRKNFKLCNNDASFNNGNNVNKVKNFSKAFGTNLQVEKEILLNAKLNNIHVFF
jgi:hypothetical protein